MTTRVLVIAGAGERSAAFMRALWRRDLEVFVASSSPSHEALLYVNPRRRVRLPSHNARDYAQAVYEHALEHQIDVVAPIEPEALDPLELRRDSFEHAGIRLLRLPVREEQVPPEVAELADRVSSWRAVPGMVASSLHELCESLRPRRLVEVE